jgi:membrane-bound lytic murein transglycosylase D
MNRLKARIRLGSESKRKPTRESEFGLVSSSFGKRAVSVISLLATLGVVGCASQPAQYVEEVEIESPGSDLAFNQRPARQPELPKEILGVPIANRDFDFPVVVNSDVLKWVSYFAKKRGRRHFKRYLERSEFFIPYIQPILRKKGLPGDLVYLAMIESGFNNHARSHARAVGPWQFIRSTGRIFGLEISYWIDERRNIRKSTLAAAQYLRRLHRIFGRWELAAAAYNAGEGKVARAVRRYRTRDFWAISKHRFLRPETRNYVPKIMAAAIVAKNREAFGFPASEVEDQRVLARKRRSSIELDAKVQKVLESYRSHQDGEFAASLVAPKERFFRTYAHFAPTPHVGRRGKVGKERLADFEIEGPADLYKVARAAGISYTHVKRLNPELLRWCTPPGRTSVRIQLPVESKERFMVNYNHPEFPRKIEYRRYKVRKGDTVGRIARRFGVSMKPILEINGLRSARRLRAGKYISLPLPARRKSMADLNVWAEDPAAGPVTRLPKKSKKVAVQTKGLRRLSARERRRARKRPNSAWVGKRESGE